MCQKTRTFQPTKVTKCPFLIKLVWLMLYVLILIYYFQWIAIDGNLGNWTILDCSMHRVQWHFKSKQFNIIQTRFILKAFQFPTDSITLEEDVPELIEDLKYLPDILMMRCQRITFINWKFDKQKLYVLLFVNVQVYQFHSKKIGKFCVVFI